MIPGTFSLQAIAIAFWAGITLGCIGGGYTVHRVYEVSRLENANRVLTKRIEAFHDALKLNKAIDDENDDVEKQNEDTDRAITARALERAGKAVDDPVCVDADDMRAIGQFR